MLRFVFHSVVLLAAFMYSVPVLANDQSEFIEIVESSREQYLAGSNDFQKGAARAARKEKLCNLFSGDMRVRDWLGTLTKISTNSDGWGILDIEIYPEIHVKTWNNSFSDMFDETLVRPDEPLYAALGEVTEGRKVKFSDTFISSEEAPDCIKESSITMRGSMTEPEFIFKFSEIKIAE